MRNTNVIPRGSNHWQLSDSSHRPTLQYVACTFRAHVYTQCRSAEAELYLPHIIVDMLCIRSSTTPPTPSHNTDHGTNQSHSPVDHTASPESAYAVVRLGEWGFQADHLSTLQATPGLAEMILGKYPEFGYSWEDEELFDSDNQPKADGDISHSGPVAGYSDEKPPKLSPVQFMRIVTAARPSSGEDLNETEEPLDYDEVEDVLSKLGELIEQGFSYEQVDTLLDRTTDREIWDVIAHRSKEMEAHGISKDDQISQAVVNLGSEGMHIAAEIIRNMILANV